MPITRGGTPWRQPSAVRYAMRYAKLQIPSLHPGTGRIEKLCCFYRLDDSCVQLRVGMSFLLFATFMRAALWHVISLMYVALLFSYHRSHPGQTCRTDGKQNPTAYVVVKALSIPSHEPDLRRTSSNQSQHSCRNPPSSGIWEYACGYVLLRLWRLWHARARPVYALFRNKPALDYA